MIKKNTFLTPAICGVWFVPMSDVVTVFAEPNGFYFHVTLSAGADWKQVYFTPGSAELSEKPKETDAGLLYEQSLRMNYPGDDADNILTLDAITDRAGLVKIQLSSGQFRLMGTIENGSRMMRSLQVGSKATGHQLEFTCLSPRAMGWTGA
jgi:hypothetical protein